MSYIMVKAPTGLLFIRVFEETKSFCSDQHTCIFSEAIRNRRNAGHTENMRQIAISVLLTHFFFIF